MKKLKDKDIKYWVKIFSLFLLFGTIGAFAYFNTCFITQGVKIEASISRINQESSVFAVEGFAKKATMVAINGREIFIDKDGYFRELIDPLPGYSVVKIEASDKFKNHKEKKFELVEKEDAESIAFKEKEEEIIN